MSGPIDTSIEGLRPVRLRLCILYAVCGHEMVERSWAPVPARFATPHPVSEVDTSTKNRPHEADGFVPHQEALWTITCCLGSK